MSVVTPGPVDPHQPRSWRNRGRMPGPHRERLATRAAALAFADAAAAAAWSPTVLDIGFGYGESLLALGLARPHDRILGVDVHSPGQLRAMDRIAESELSAVRVLPSDVTNVLPLLEPGSLSLVQAFHPDPWPKRKHAVRRLLQPPVVARLAVLLAPAGVLHVVIDDDTYAASVSAAAGELPLAAIDPPPVPETKYGRRALAAGRTVHTMAWTKI